MNCKETLENKVDLEKVKEIRKAIRRRYANRKNFAKIFSNWDKEGKGYLTIKNVHEMLNNLGIIQLYLYLLL
jgi:Ca2+-binding EF-hand superfamily protein